MSFLPVGMQLDHKRPLHTASVIHVGPGKSHVMRDPSVGTTVGSGHMERHAIWIYTEAQGLVHSAVTLTVTLAGSLTSLGLDVLLGKWRSGHHHSLSFFPHPLLCISDEFESSTLLEYTFRFSTSIIVLRAISSLIPRDTVWNSNWWIISIWNTVFFLMPPCVPAAATILQMGNYGWFFSIFSHRLFSSEVSELGIGPTF